MFALGGGHLAYKLPAVAPSRNKAQSRHVCVMAPPPRPYPLGQGWTPDPSWPNQNLLPGTGRAQIAGSEDGCPRPGWDALFSEKRREAGGVGFRFRIRGPIRLCTMVVVAFLNPDSLRQPEVRLTDDHLGLKPLRRECLKLAT